MRRWGNIKGYKVWVVETQEDHCRVIDDNIYVSYKVDPDDIKVLVKMNIIHEVRWSEEDWQWLNKQAATFGAPTSATSGLQGYDLEGVKRKKHLVRKKRKE